MIATLISIVLPNVDLRSVVAFVKAPAVLCWVIVYVSGRVKCCENAIATWCVVGTDCARAWLDLECAACLPLKDTKSMGICYRVAGVKLGEASELSSSSHRQQGT